MKVAMKLKGLKTYAAEGETDDSEADRFYLRTKVLLFLLCQYVPAINLAALCSSASRIREGAFLVDLHIAGLDEFIRHLAQELFLPTPDPRQDAPLEKGEHT